MTNLISTSRSLTLATLLALSLHPATALAGKQADAVDAIAQAHGKIDAGDKVGVNVEAPELQAQARSELTSAEALLADHKKSEAITAAKHAGELADQAIVSADTRKASAERDRRLDAQSAAIAAQQAAATANVRADNAQQAAASANSRADTAQVAAMSANAQAEALRNAKTPAAPTTTTVAIEENSAVTPPAVVHHVRHRIVHKRSVTSRAGRTTTVTTTTH